jgi:hypothetical protein
VPACRVPVAGKHVRVPIRSSAALRTAAVVGIVILAAASVVSLLGGLDPLADALPLLFGLVLLVWFGVEPPKRPGDAGRRLRWVGLAAAVVLIAASVGDLLT